jgi:hypothetical protein
MKKIANPTCGMEKLANQTCAPGSGIPMGDALEMMRETVGAVANQVNKPGSAYSGTAFRADYSGSPFKEKGMTVGAILAYEEELGNDTKSQAMPVLKSLGIDPDNVPASRLTWVSETKDFASKFGDAEEVMLPQGSIVIASDEEGGHLVLLP